MFIMFGPTHYLTQSQKQTMHHMYEFNTDLSVCVSINQCVVVKAVASL